MRYLIIICTVLIFASCKFENNQNKVADASKEIENWTCIPGEKVGLIQKNFTEGDIIKAYGKENVSREEISLGEGFMVTATVVFPNTDNVIFVSWKEGQEFKKIAEILIEKEKAPWTTTQGIGIGTTLDELIKINGKDFQFAGFEWDYSGITEHWEDGKVSEYLTVFLEPNKPEVIYPDLVGDKLFSSNHPKAKLADLKVRTMIIKFE